MSDDKGVLVELDNAYYNDEEYNFQAKYSEDHFVIKEFKDDDMDSKLKVQASIQGEQVRVSGKSRDDLQTVIQLLRKNEEKYDAPLQFTNYR